MHLLHLAGIGACVSDVPGASRPKVSEPDQTDYLADLLPDCADTRLAGAVTPQKGPSSPSSTPIFISTTPALSDGSGSLNGPTSWGVTIGVEPNQPFKLTATVDASGDPKLLGDYEIGFVQTALSEEWVNTHVDGRREIRRLPLPLRDGAPRFDIVNGVQIPNPFNAPPWFDANSKVKPKPGLNMVQLLDQPNFRAFSFHPDLTKSRFVDRKKFGSVSLERPEFKPNVSTEVDKKPDTPMKPDEQKAFDEKTKIQAVQREAEKNDAPDKGLRRVRLMSWVVARHVGAAATHSETEFLEGVNLDFAIDVDWQTLPAGGIRGTGSYKTTATKATRADSDQMLLRGATPQDFVVANQSPEGEPLFAEFLSTENALPRDQAQGLTQTQFTAAVRAIVKQHLPMKGLIPPFVVQVRLDVATGRLVLDTPGLDRHAVTVTAASGSANPDRAAAAAFSLLIYPELRKLVLSGPFSGAQPTSPTITFPIIIS
jgi:hypothetical protein